MSGITLTKQYIRDAAGQLIGVILPIEEYQALKQSWTEPVTQLEPPGQSLYGILRHLGGTIAPTEILDETRRECWA